MRADPWSLGVAAVVAAFALATLIFWIPADIESGVVETFRRRVIIGDALAPTVVAIAMLVVAGLFAATELLRPRQANAPFDRQSAVFIVRVAAAIGAGLALMVYTGPLTVDAINAAGGEIGSYRQLRDTVPYKYLGYLAGGTVMVGGIVAVVEQRLARSAAAAAVLAVLVHIVLYDLPFDDVLLPPNGDQ